MITSDSSTSDHRPHRDARRGRWAAYLAAAAAVSLLPSCALLPSPQALGGDRDAPAASATPQPSTPTSPSPRTSQAPSASAAAIDADAEARAQAVLAAVYADGWGTQFDMTLDSLPEGTDTQTALAAASALQTWTIATVAADSVLQAGSPQAALDAYQRLLPAGVDSRVTDYLDNSGQGPATTFALLTTLGPGVDLLADPAIHMDYAPTRVSDGPNAGDLRLTASVLAIYPVTYQAQDYAVPVHRLIGLDMAPDGTIDSLYEKPVQYLAACSVLTDGTLTPDVSLPADIALEGVDHMVYNSPILAQSLLADPREEPSLMPVRRLQCDDGSS